MSEKQSIPNGTKCQVDWMGHESELIYDLDMKPSWFEVMNNSEVIIESLESATGEIGDKDYEYYNVIFNDKTVITGLSGYYLTF